jgi:TRAP-type C4-dicarboxylate transport system permease small subunit
MKVLRQTIVIFDRVNSLLSIFVAVLITFLMLGVCTEIGARLFFNYSIDWMLETTEYSLLYITFLGAAWLLKEEGHVRMDLVLNRLSPRTQALVNVITSFLGAIACLVLAVYSAQCTWENFRMGYHIESALDPPKFIIVAVIPVASILLFIQFLRRSYGYLDTWRGSRDRNKGYQMK